MLKFLEHIGQSLIPVSQLRLVILPFKMSSSLCVCLLGLHTHTNTHTHNTSAAIFTVLATLGYNHLLRTIKYSYCTEHPLYIHKYFLLICEKYTHSALLLVLPISVQHCLYGLTLLIQTENSVIHYCPFVDRIHKINNQGPHSENLPKHERERVI